MVLAAEDLALAEPPAVPTQQVPAYAGSIGCIGVYLSQPPCDFWANKLFQLPGDTCPRRREPRLDLGTGHLNQQWKHMQLPGAQKYSVGLSSSEKHFSYFISLNIEDTFFSSSSFLPQFSCKPFAMALLQHCWEKAGPRSPFLCRLGQFFTHFYSLRLCQEGAQHFTSPTRVHLPGDMIQDSFLHGLA